MNVCPLSSLNSIGDTESRAEFVQKIEGEKNAIISFIDSAAYCSFFARLSSLTFVSCVVMR